MLNEYKNNLTDTIVINIINEFELVYSYCFDLEL